MESNRKVVITSGFFNPPHIGHMNLLRESKKLGDFLIVIVNNDKQVKLKGSISFMKERERMRIIGDLKYVDKTLLSIDRDTTVAKSLESIARKHPVAKLLFAKGGDRNSDNIPESEKKVCQKFNIKIVNGVGGDKIQSSSWLLNKIALNNGEKK